MKISKILFSLLVSVSLICSCNNNKVPESLFEAGKGPWLNEIANDVYLVEDNNNGGNVCFIVGKREVLVVDAGTFPSASSAVTEMIRQVTDKDIGYVVFTHCHSDHVAGVAGYPKVSGSLPMKICRQILIHSSDRNMQDFLRCCRRSERIHFV